MGDHEATHQARPGVGMSWSRLTRLNQLSNLLSMLPESLRKLRTQLGLSRTELARFVGVSHATAVRWEAGAGSVPKGVALVLLVAIQRAAARWPKRQVAALIRDGPAQHARAIQTLLAMAAESETPIVPAQESYKQRQGGRR